MLTATGEQSRRWRKRPTIDVFSPRSFSLFCTKKTQQGPNKEAEVSDKRTIVVYKHKRTRVSEIN